MKTLLLILISFSLSAQKITDDVKHHYAGVGITIISGSLMHKATKHRFLSLVTGLACGICAGIAKEEIWDRKMGRGTPSEMDKINTAWGSICGTMYLGLGLHFRNRKIDTTFYKNYGTP